MRTVEVMQQLRALGTAQNRKVYARHVTGAMFGVSYANLGKLRRQIKIDHELAVQLWATGNLDAQTLATMIADPDRSTARMLDGWVSDVTNRGTAAALSNLAALSRTRQARADKWMKSNRQWIANTGWYVLSSLARDDPELHDDYFEAWLDRIEARIQAAPNWTRYAMNTALISIGVRNARLQKRAVAVAKRLGPVEVEHGETWCQTPDAVAYIQKGAARREKKAAKTRSKH